MTESKIAQSKKNVSRKCNPKSSYEAEAAVEDNEGPKPMRHNRDSEKVRNAADQFSDHHREYKMRGGPSYDRMEQVQRHNATNPRLHDELEKRRSTAKVTANNTKRQKLDNYICAACMKLRKYRRVRNMQLKTKHNYSKKPRTQSVRDYEKKSNSRRTYRKAHFRKTKGSKAKERCANQIGHHHKHKGDDGKTSVIFMTNAKNRRSRLHIDEEPSDREDLPPDEYLDTDEDKTDVSIDSYKSNFSMDEEPMLS